MKSHQLLRNFNVRHHYLLTQPAHLRDVDLETLFDAPNFDWEEKAKRLQIRRWRKLRHLEAG